MAENYYLNHTATQIDAILTKVDGIAAGANVNVQVDWNQTTTTADDYIKNKPTIPDAQVNSDWNAVSGVAQILNKPTIPDAQIQSDWEQTNTESKDFIKNKPTIPDAQIQSDWNQTNTESKDFIKNKPTIPPAQVNSDWEASSGVAQILNKPTLGTAAAKDYTTFVTSGSNDLVTSGAVDVSQAMQDARILSLEQRVDNRLEHYGMKWEKENSDPQARCTYLYDCANFTPMQCQNDGSVSMGSWANAFFIRNNYPAMVKPDGVIDYLLDPNDHSKKLDRTASHVEDHETDNAMAIFDCHIWIKMAEDETHQYIEVANQKLDDDFVDFPYHRADGTVKDKLYYPMFEGSIIGGKLRSLATGAVPQSSTISSEEQPAAQANGANWSIGDWSHHLWITLLSMLVGKSTCPEMALGEGNTAGGSTAVNFSKCGELKTSGQFYGKPQAVSTTSPVKLFFSENPYGNRWKRTLGMYNVLGTYYIKSSPPYTIDESYNDYERCGGNPSGSGYVKDLKLTSMGFVPSSVGGSSSTYTGAYYNESDTQINMLLVGGNCGNGAACGFWSLYLHLRPSFRSWDLGASLYLM